MPLTLTQAIDVDFRSRTCQAIRCLFQGVRLQCCMCSVTRVAVMFLKPRNYPNYNYNAQIISEIPTHIVKLEGYTFESFSQKRNKYQ
uniref:Uncharacterized protein n=1 Tax=Triticum urartu TaxID=4572 RepID=A0A8R7UI47_TRIUA